MRAGGSGLTDQNQMQHSPKRENTELLREEGGDISLKGKECMIGNTGNRGPEQNDIDQAEHQLLNLNLSHSPPQLT